MNDVIAAQAPPKITFTELNVRQEKGKPHFVRLNDNVVKRLERQLIDKPPVTGSERSGLLLGSIESGEQCTFAVEDFEPAAKLEERIGSWTPRAGSKQRIVGYYRSHRQADFAPDQADHALFERCFPRNSRVVLLVKPPAAVVGTAMFFVGENGQLGADRATVEFPFNLRELGAEDASAPGPATPPGAKPAAVAAAPAVQKPASGSRSVLLKIAVAGGVVIASVFGLNALHVFHSPAEAPTLTTETDASVKPAEAKPVVETPAAQPQPEQTPQATPPVPKPQPVPPVVATAKPQSKPKLDKSPATAPVVPIIAPAQQTLVAQNTSPNPLVVPQTRPLTLAAPVAPASLPPSTPMPGPKPAEASEPVTPPHAIRQIAPVLPEKVSRAIVGEAVVRLRVNVDAAGTVTSAEPVAGGSPISDAIVGAAVSAVKHWQFEPARRGGEKVAGDLMLSFIFRK